MFKIDIINTGSDGNAVVIDDLIQIDCGLSFKKMKESGILERDFLFITHKHSDHINLATLNGIRKNFAYDKLKEMVYTNKDVVGKIRTHKELVDVEVNVIKYGDIFEITTSKGNKYQIEVFECKHDCENTGFVFTNEIGEKLVYATDTSTMRFAPKIQYDYIVIEGNYDEEEVLEALESDDYAISFRAASNARHLSVQQFEKFVQDYGKNAKQIFQLHESGTFGMKSRFTE